MKKITNTENIDVVNWNFMKMLQISLKIISMKGKQFTFYYKVINSNAPYSGVFRETLWQFTISLLKLKEDKTFLPDLPPFLHLPSFLATITPLFLPLNSPWIHNINFSLIVSLVFNF